MDRTRPERGFPRLRLLGRALGDRLFEGLTEAAALTVLVLLSLIVLLLVQRSYPTISLYGFSFLWGRDWNPSPPAPVVFGALPFLYGTLVTALIGVLLGVPLSLGIAIFLTELAPGWLRSPLSFAVELLASIPSVIYGLWGLLVLVPVMRADIEPALRATLGGVPVIGGLFTPSSFGFLGLDKFTAGVILAIMIVPTVSAVAREAFFAVPNDQREAALSLGATRWETTRISVLSYARTGILGAITLGLGRAIGETIAVTFVIGNNNTISGSLLVPGQTIASWIANQFNESVNPLEKNALLELGLVLLGISLLINVAARLLLRGTPRLEAGRA